MFRFCVAASLLVVVLSAPQGFPTAEESKAELVAAGLSDAAATEIIAIGAKNAGLLESAKGDRDAALSALGVIKNEADAYIKTQSQADQTAWAAFIEKKKNDLQARKEAAGI